MGKVALTFNINLESPQVDAEKVRKQLEKISGYNTAEIKPLAFGMKQIVALFMFDDRKGANTDEIEKKISAVKGVGSVEAGDITLV